MSQIDWSKAPEWAVAHALFGFNGVSEVWVGEDKWQHVDQSKAFPYGGGVSDARHNPTRERFEFETLRPAPWNGEGLPPVGTTCETSFTDIEGSSWRDVIILAHGARRIFLRENSGDEFAQRIDECEFRPFRTPEQIAAEEIQKIRDEINWQRPYLGPCPVEKLYRLGYRKQRDS